MVNTDFTANVGNENMQTSVSDKSFLHHFPRTGIGSTFWTPITWSKLHFQEADEVPVLLAGNLANCNTPYTVSRERLNRSIASLTVYIPPCSPVQQSWKDRSGVWNRKSARVLFSRGCCYGRRASGWRCGSCRISPGYLRACIIPSRSESTSYLQRQHRYVSCCNN